MGIRYFVCSSFLVLSSLQAQKRDVKNQSEHVVEYLKSTLMRDKEIKSSGLLEKISSDSKRSFARYDLSFDGLKVQLAYEPFDKEASYKLLFAKGTLTAQDIKKKVVLKYSGSEGHLFSFIERAFSELQGNEKTLDSIFDSMLWKMEKSKDKVLIQALAYGDFPVRILRLEFDQLSKLKMMAIEMKNNEAYALWSDE